MPPELIILGVINQNVPVDNAGLFIGEGNIGGWDSNVKANHANGGTVGFFNVQLDFVNINIDNVHVFDGVINDQDYKFTCGLNL